MNESFGFYMRIPNSSEQTFFTENTAKVISKKQPGNHLLQKLLMYNIGVFSSCVREFWVSDSLKNTSF